VADRYCPSCGTEVDADARFCPSCGITLEDGGQSEVPAAPSWPEQAAPTDRPPPARAEGPAASESPPADHAGIDLPFTWPTTASGWLIGIGSVVGAIALLPNLGSLLNVLLFLALLVVAAWVFLAERMPNIPHRRLITLVVTAIGLGIALDRSAFAVRGLETLLLLAMLAAFGGALLIELDRDRPMPPPGPSGG
jgi:zinc ribbon protein